MEQPIEEDNSGYPHLLASGKRHSVWPIFKAIWTSRSLQGLQTLRTMLDVSLLLLVMKGSHKNSSVRVPKM